MGKLGVIGGTGLSAIDGFSATECGSADTPWGKASALPVCGELAGVELVFLSRHGDPHVIPPHRVNYRANLWALHTLGVTHVVAVAAVGGIHADMRPGVVVVPGQLIDYTWGRAQTYHEQDLDAVVHIDFTRPYCERMRQQLLASAVEAGVAVVDGGTYAATQGPRLETSAEIDRLERDGCHVVGMTGMPEAALARELDIGYAHLVVIANAAAGRGAETITMEDIEANLVSGMAGVYRLLNTLAAGYGAFCASS